MVNPVAPAVQSLASHWLDRRDGHLDSHCRWTEVALLVTGTILERRFRPAETTSSLPRLDAVPSGPERPMTALPVPAKPRYLHRAFPSELTFRRIRFSQISQASFPASLRWRLFASSGY